MITDIRSKSLKHVTVRINLPATGGDHKHKAALQQALTALANSIQFKDANLPTETDVIRDPLSHRVVGMYQVTESVNGQIISPLSEVQEQAHAV